MYIRRSLCWSWPYQIVFMASGGGEVSGAGGGPLDVLVSVVAPQCMSKSSFMCLIL